MHTDASIGQWQAEIGHRAMLDAAEENLWYTPAARAQAITARAEHARLRAVRRALTVDRRSSVA